MKIQILKTENLVKKNTALPRCVWYLVYNLNQALDNWQLDKTNVQQKKKKENLKAMNKLGLKNSICSNCFNNKQEKNY